MANEQGLNEEIIHLLIPLPENNQNIPTLIKKSELKDVLESEYLSICLCSDQHLYKFYFKLLCNPDYGPYMGVPPPF